MAFAILTHSGYLFGYDFSTFLFNTLWQDVVRTVLAAAAEAAAKQYQGAQYAANDQENDTVLFPEGFLGFVTIGSQIRHL